MSDLDRLALGVAAAALAGPRRADMVRERVARALGEAPEWLDRFVRRLLRRLPDSTVTLAPADLAPVIARDAAFRRAAGEHLRLRGFFPFHPQMRPRPAALADAPMPDLPTPGDIAAWLGIDIDRLDWLADRRRSSARVAAGPLQHYAYRAVRKPSGGLRVIEAPKRRLRGIQRRILCEILEYVPPHEAAHAFRRGRSIVTHAAPHCAREMVLRMDLEDFFPSIGGARVRALFATLGFPEAAARTLAGLCTNRTPREILGMRDPFSGRAPSPREIARYTSDHLPQGAPTSPALANLIAFGLDLRLGALAAETGATYSRYADDLVFSGDQRLARSARRFEVLVGRIALEEGFTPNFRKTKVMRSGGRQEVTGVVVNRHANVLRADYDSLKALLHNCVRRGADGQNRTGRAGFRAHLAGRIAHVAMINAARGAKLKAIFDRVQWERPR